MRIAIFDYGAGNLHSLRKALERAGAEVVIDTDAARCASASLLVLPGVGAFGHAAQRLAPARDHLRSAVAGGLPVIGVCLGMQLLFDASDEGPGEGLGLIPGRVVRLKAQRLPHIGWNSLEPSRGAVALSMPYFAHSFVCRPDDAACVTAWCTHERDRFPAVVRAGRVAGVQFHPEKSGDAGVGFLVTLAREAMCS